MMKDNNKIAKRQQLPSFIEGVRGWVFFLLLLLSLPSFAQQGGGRIGMYAIGFYNLENLFDTKHDVINGVDKNDYEYLQRKEGIRAGAGRRPTP